jgi:sporulation protein YlmC with PRC-barrel domain
MLSKAKTLQDYSLQNTNGETIGKVKEFYFDDRHWTVRYLVADTGTWLSGRQVLISPYALVAVNNDHQNIVVALTQKQIEDSPSLDSDKPVSRQFEQAYYGYYGWPIYWSGSYAWGPSPYLVRDPEQWKTSTQRETGWDPYLRSTYNVSGHHIQALDGEIGHVADFVIDDETWAIRYLIVDTHNWWPGKKVLISTRWIERVSWGERKVFVNLSRDAIKRSPEYKEESMLDRDYEVSLHQHYNRQGYWLDELVAK